MSKTPQAVTGDWWGVMFPSLTVSAETDGAVQTFAGSKDGYKLKFKSVEIIHSIENGIKSGR